jgi:hypothetical protein
MKRRRSYALVFLIAAAVLLAGQAWAQNPTGTLTGRLSDADGGALPGVTVTAESPALQGTRTTVTNENGDYKLALLPPGVYQVTYALEGFNTSVREIKLSAAQTTPSNITLQIGTVAEAMVVTGQQASISETGTAATTITFDEIENLPVPRELDDVVNLTPGVANSGFRDSTPVMAGAPSYENLYMVNGVVINENVRAEILNLFIEDAVQETTTSISGISAEYGRFTGGVVNAITKTGGNEFTGSIRANLENESWESKTPLTGDQTDELNKVYEATLGGFIMKDHLWFFGAGRDRETADTAATDFTDIDYPRTDEETRTEIKLTVSPNNSNTIIGSYLDIDRVRTNTDFGTILDLRSLNPNRGDPQEISSINYTGILNQNFFAEAQWSERDYIIGAGSGGPRDLINGTLMRTMGEGFRYWSPTFCGPCDNEERNNENLLAKGSYFLSTAGSGTHDFVFGYDTFEDIRFVVNHQTGSDFTLYGTDVIRDAAGDPIIDPASNSAIPVFGGPGSVPRIRWFAVFNEDLARPTSFNTNSFYVNDSWQMNDKWSFNVGVRFDENDGIDSSGTNVANDSKFSPRLGLNYDLKGNGDLILRASAATYVAGLNQQADSASPGGAIGSLRYEYYGPDINVGCTVGVDCLPADQVIRLVFDWYEQMGGVYDLAQLDPNAAIVQYQNDNDVPGATTQAAPSGLKSPAVDEITFGIGKRLGNKGLFRADVILREWVDHYGIRRDLSTGQVDTSTGPADIGLIGNFDKGISREYQGLITSFRYRLSDKLNVSVNYTLSELEGNWEGESSNSAANYAEFEADPEYKEARWNKPTGNLRADQRHTLRAWGVYDVFDNDRHSLNVSWLENYFSGSPRDVIIDVDPRPYVTNPGYADPPSGLDYYPEGKGSASTDDVHRSDFSANYSFTFRDFEIFVQPEIVNIFNEHAVIDPNLSTRELEDFNPFTETPIEGTHWEKRSTFGNPQNAADYQAPREYRFSVGFRF